MTGLTHIAPLPILPDPALPCGPPTAEPSISEGLNLSDSRVGPVDKPNPLARI